MTQDSEQQQVRVYLLGELRDEEQCRVVEERLLTDNDFCEQIEMVEDELIEQYLDGELSEKERVQFEQCFLQTKERREKFSVARSINRYATSRSTPSPASEPVEPDTIKNRSAATKPAKLYSFWTRWPVGAYAGLAAGLVILVLGGLWLLLNKRNSDIERGLLALNEAYRQERPTEARITGLGYAPAPTTRGTAPGKFDYVARDRAERLFQDALNQNKSSEALHALGKLYLAQRQFDKAIDQLEAALATAPNDAQLHSDLGAALLERGKSRPPDATDGAALADFSKSLEHLNRALALDASLQDALFNRALLYQSMKLPRQAADDWRRFLELDDTSSWGSEAREHLKLLQQRQSGFSDAPQVLGEFLNAYRAQSDERAWQVMSSTREMITRRMVPFQLVRDLLQAETQDQDSLADELRDALKYAGALEQARSGDPYVAELARYYSSLDNNKRQQLAGAYAELEQAYRLCQASQYDTARTHFERARALFAAAANEHEARLTDYWLAYCISQSDRLDESVKLLEKLAAFCRERGYRWLLSQALCLLANCYDLQGDHSRSLAFDRDALDIALAINDSYNQQKLLTQLALQYTQLGRPEHALGYHQRTLFVASESPIPRQDWRNFTFTAHTFYRLKLYDAAVAYEREALRLSLDELRDPALAHLSYTQLGMILAGMGRHDDAMREVEAGLKIASVLQNDSASRKMIAYSQLQLGHVIRQRGDCGPALEHYHAALQLYAGMEIGKLDIYDVRKGRLLCYLDGKDDSTIESELSQVLALFEQDRQEIAEEQNRNSFFDAEEGIYDIAIGYAYAKGDSRRAFTYSEQSRGRSLLDLLVHGVKPGVMGEEPEVLFEAAASSLDLIEIQAQIPPGMQMVQYAALKDKLLIWVVSRARFEVREHPITGAELNARVLDYVTLLTRNDQSQQHEVRRRAEDLYDLLISPIAPFLQDTGEVCIIPDKALFHLPFAALVSRATGNYLVQDFSLQFAPSASVLVECSRTAQQRHELQSPEILLSVGNPSFDRDSYPQLADLPAAEVEAQKVAEIYGGAPPLIGMRARKSVFAELLSRANVIHFAGHYVADERAPMRSRLLLAKDPAGDDALTAAEVFGKKLPQARLVILSACQTELEGFDNGEGMIGIARTFLAAGAPLVVATQWPVDSGATAELMIRFHQLRKLQGQTTTNALRSAQLEMLASVDERHRNPYYWAAFLPVGGYASY